MKKHSTNTFPIDDIGEEIIVGFDYEFKYDTGEHTGHNLVNESTIELTSVEVVMCGVGVDILPQLNQEQKHLIISKIEINGK
jgi:hypothetical protein